MAQLKYVWVRFRSAQPWEDIPDFPFVVLDINSQVISYETTGPSGVINIDYLYNTAADRIFILPNAANMPLWWDAPYWLDGSNQEHTSKYQVNSNVLDNNIWYCEPLTAPNKPIITATNDQIHQVTVEHNPDREYLARRSYLYRNTIDDFETAGIISSASWITRTDAQGYDYTIAVDSTGQVTMPYYYWKRSNNLDEHGNTRWGLPSDSVVGMAIGIPPPPIVNKLKVTPITSGGTIAHPTCGAQEYPNSCEGDWEVGTDAAIIANPRVNYGWNVNVWSVIPNTVNLEVAEDKLSAIVRSMPNEPVEVQVSFVRDLISLNLSVGDGDGEGNFNCIEIVSPAEASVPCSGGQADVDSLIYSNVTLKAIPSNNWDIKATDTWEIDGSPATEFDGMEQIPFPIDGLTSVSRTVIVNFEEELPCDKNTLTIYIEGGGTVSPPAGQYCTTDVVPLTPNPFPNYDFKEWIYQTSTSITEDGIRLIVPMNEDRYVTAVFIPKGDVEPIEPTYALFYCSSETYKDNVVSFDFTNNQDPSSVGVFHFRVSFYADVGKKKLIYSAFSLSDNKRWYYNDGSFEQIPIDGKNITGSQTMTILYDPEILSQQNTESQKEHVINNDVIYEKPLICGINYYVEVESYNVVSNTLDVIKNISFILDCKKVNSHYWGDDGDKNNWLCSGQGKSDLQVNSGNDQSIVPAIASNNFGLFQVVWQSRRTTGNNIYGVVWDSTKDMLYSSGQGMYDKLEIKNADHPLIVTDQASNFYITGHLGEEIKFKACPFAPCVESVFDDPIPPTGVEAFESFCYPGSSSLLNSSYDMIKARVYEEDISGSLVINNNKVVPVIDKQSIRFDIDGIVGAYAVRLRNIEDASWSEWINIDGELYGEEIGADIVHSAYKIDNSRIIVPWDVARANGLRRVCCQILTMYGISNTFCVDILVNFDVTQHVFRFYKDASRNDLFPTYNGQYVLSIKGSSTPNDAKAIAYFEVIFNEPIYANETNDVPYVTGDIKFNVVQQGVNDERRIDLEVPNSNFNNKRFIGQFDIYNDDGIFNKDGVSFIELIFPGTIEAEACDSDTSDKYNLVNSDIEEIANIDLVPEEVYQKYQRDKLSKTLDLNKFKQYYDKDDVNFKFGNPEYFKDS